MDFELTEEQRMLKKQVARFRGPGGHSPGPDHR